MIKSSKQQTPTNMRQPNDGDPIEHPSDNDVLSGRGGRINNHSGNIHFRKLVTEEKAKYISLNKKMDKKYIAIDIVDQLRKLEPPGRFLKKDGLHWYEIGDERARKKAAQALREDGPGLRKEMDQRVNVKLSHDYIHQNIFPSTSLRYNSMQSTYPCMSGSTRRPEFHHHTNPSVLPINYLMQPSLSSNGSKSTMPDSKTSFQNPYQFNQTYQQFSGEYLKSIPSHSIPNDLISQNVKCHHTHVKNFHYAPTLKQNNELSPIRTHDEKVFNPVEMDFEPIPMNNMKRRRVS